MESGRNSRAGAVWGWPLVESHGVDASSPHIRSSILRVLALLAFLFTFTTGIRGEDTVIYATGTDSLGRGSTSGTIIDYTGENLILRTSGGREQRIPTPRVIEIKTTWSPKKLVGDEMIEAGEFDEAVKNYLTAYREERRNWARREIAAQCIRCYRELAQFDRAAEAFLSLLQLDPKTQHFHAIPLSWAPYQPPLTLQQKAKSWLESGQSPPARLLGASWLLSTGTREVAIGALRELATDSDARIAALAEAQLWRTQVATAKPQDIERWQRMVERMPDRLRAGPYFTLARALAGKQQGEQAALAFLRVPILYPKAGRLAAAALLSAGRELEKIGQTKEAVVLYHEVVRDHSQTPAAAEASSRLESLAAGQGSG